MKKTDDNKKNNGSAAHGGDIYSREIRLDFSVNTNPLTDGIFDAVINSGAKGWRGDILEAGIRGLSFAGKYPDIRCRKLKKALSRIEGIPEKNIICGNGASELFMALAHAVRPAKALLTAPCYSGYSYALDAVGCSTDIHQLKEGNGFIVDKSFLESLREDTEILFLANPNNPNGRLIAPDILSLIIDECKKKNIILVLDACFYPLASDLALDDAHLGGSNGEDINRLLYEYENLVIVKAFTKIMSMPGLRLGYLMSENEELLKKIEAQLPEWNVSAIAQEVGAKAADVIASTDLISKSRAYVEKERKYLAKELSRMGYKVYDSDVNYILFKAEPELYERLVERKILIRDCQYFEGLYEGYYRIAVRTHEENEELINNIKIVGEKKE